MPTVITQGAATAKAYGFSAKSAVRGCAVYTTPGTYTFTVPAGVTSISIVAVGAGESGYPSGAYCAGCCGIYFSDGYGGYGGGLAYKNNYTVSPGQTLTIKVGCGSLTCAGVCCVSSAVKTSGCTTIAKGIGGWWGGGNTPCNPNIGDGSGTGGVRGNSVGYYGSIPFYNRAGGGGGAGGYSGAGGTGTAWCYCSGSLICATAGSGGGGGGGGAGGNGGGVGLYGQGCSGVAGGGTGSATCYPCCSGVIGGGGGGSYTYTYCGGYIGTPGAVGGNGGVRIVYPGTTRQFPSTDVAYP